MKRDRIPGVLFKLSTKMINKIHIRIYPPGSSGWIMCVASVSVGDSSTASCQLYCFPYIHSSFLPSSSVSLSYLILAVPLRKCSGEHSCRSFILPIVMLNGTCFLRGEMVLVLAEASPVKNEIWKIIYCINHGYLNYGIRGEWCASGTCVIYMTYLPRWMGGEVDSQYYYYVYAV